MATSHCKPVRPFRGSRAASNPFSGQRRDLRTDLRHLVASPEAAVVFSSLAELCVPGFSDQCQIFIAQAGGTSYEIHRPSTGPEAHRPPGLDRWPACLPRTQRVGLDSVVTTIESTRLRGLPEYRGVVVHRWVNGYTPGLVEAGLAQLGVDRAVAVITRERLIELNSSLAIRPRSTQDRAGR